MEDREDSETESGEATTPSRKGRGSACRSVAEAIERFTPTRVPPEIWTAIEDPVRQWVRTAEPVDPQRARSMLNVVVQIAHWVALAGEPLDAEVVLHPNTIDRFVRDPHLSLTKQTRSTYRGYLRTVGRAVLGPAQYPPRPVSLIPDEQGRGYSPEDITAIHSWIRGRPTAETRRNATVLLALGLGAGLQSNEMARLVGTDVVRDNDGVLVNIVGKNERAVPVTERYEDTLFELATEVGERPIFRPDRTTVTRHHIPNFLENCKRQGSPAFSVQRLRTTWIVTHLEAGVPTPALSVAAAVTPYHLANYFNQLSDVDPVLARRWLRRGAAS